jgi:hypothetical protein
MEWDIAPRDTFNRHRFDRGRRSCPQRPSLPTTPIAARHTDDRRANFDIYLPEWLARHNKLIFGALYAGGILFTLAKWAFAAH